MTEWPSYPLRELTYGFEGPTLSRAFLLLDTARHTYRIAYAYKYPLNEQISVP